MSGIAGSMRENGVLGLLFLLLLSAVTMGCASPSVRMEPAQGTTQERVADDFDAERPSLDDLFAENEAGKSAQSPSDPASGLETDADADADAETEEPESDDPSSGQDQTSTPQPEPEEDPDLESVSESEPDEDRGSRRSFFARLFRRAPAVDAEEAESEPTESVEQPEPSDQSDADEAESPDEPYRLRIGDEIRLEVFREREISGTFRLTRPEGAIRHPLLGDVALKGMTLGAAETYIRQQLAEDYLVNPRVILQLAREPEPPPDPEEADLQVLVMGQVRNPGAVTFSRGERLTLLEAISLAGGFTDGASRNRVRLVRETDGKRESIRVRVDDILSGRQGHHNIELKSGDTISVPEVWF